MNALLLSGFHTAAEGVFLAVQTLLPAKNGTRPTHVYRLSEFDH